MQLVKFFRFLFRERPTFSLLFGGHHPPAFEGKTVSFFRLVLLLTFRSPFLSLLAKFRVSIKVGDTFFPLSSLATGGAGRFFCQAVDRKPFFLPPLTGFPLLNESFTAR